MTSRCDYKLLKVRVHLVALTFLDKILKVCTLSLCRGKVTTLSIDILSYFIYIIKRLNLNTCILRTLIGSRYRSLFAFCLVISTHCQELGLVSAFTSLCVIPRHKDCRVTTFLIDKRRFDIELAGIECVSVKLTTDGKIYEVLHDAGFPIFTISRLCPTYNRFVSKQSGNVLLDIINHFL